MAIVASGPPFASRPLCKCGWMWKDECKKTEGCGLKNGMPEYEQRAVHTPYEFLDGKDFGVAGDRRSEVDLNKVCREVVEGLVKDSKSTQVGGTHYAEMEVQPWDAMRAWMNPSEYAAYHIGTVIGYLARHKKKGGLTDIKKSHHHLSELIRYFEEEEEYPW